jgi:DNA-binding FadR family transcriptional regulator
MVLFAETNTPLSAAEVAQSVELRSVLESEALRLACLRRNAEDLQRLRAILDQSEAAMASGGTLADLDAEFHKAIVAATHNDVLLRFINVFYLMSRKRRETYFEAGGQSQRSHRHHLQLYRAIEAHDAEAGARILRQHLKGVDAYFRLFFADEDGAARRTPKAAGRAAGRRAPAAAPRASVKRAARR